MVSSHIFISITESVVATAENMFYSGLNEARATSNVPWLYAGFKNENVELGSLKPPQLRRLIFQTRRDPIPGGFTATSCRKESGKQAPQI